MNSADASIANSLSQYQEIGKKVEVLLSNELVRLLSEQLYQSPLKAIEELVVNAYDADAKECRVFVPLPGDTEKKFIAVYDNGDGMNYEGLVDLWQIGRSNKRSKEVERRSRRKQIGKFGIGKLATYTIANQLTYITKTGEEILGITIDFTEFKDESGKGKKSSDTANGNVSAAKSNASGSTSQIKPINLPVHKIEDWPNLLNKANLKSVSNALSLETMSLESDSWTIAILENLKDKANTIKHGSLKWVLRTAMPLNIDFKLFLNGEEITSSKEDYEKVVEFNLTELPSKRLESLSKETGENWDIEEDCLKSESFPVGIKGDVLVTRRSLYGRHGHKSEDIQRSHGFFVRVRERLVDLINPLFGIKPPRHGILNRFHADIRADDLDVYLTASRDTVEESEIKVKFRKLLREIINEADIRFQAKENEEKEKGGKKEGEKELVAPKLVERPVADALLTQRYDAKGAEADEGWFYIDIPEGTDTNELVQRLYTSPRSKYQYDYTNQGIDRLVKFDPDKSIFWINSEHELAKEYVENEMSRRLLQDFVTAEMLLEAYLRESHVPAPLIGEILQKRDDLLRSLVRDSSYSPETIARSLREATADEHELEINLVVAARALGFTANQISGSKEPDGLARYIEYPNGERKIILEAKSSKKDIRPDKADFAGLRRHAEDYNADGCLLLAPGYQGSSLDDSAVATNAKQQKISCWTVELLAQVIEAAESRHIGARKIFKIVTEEFTPNEVKQAVENLLTEPSWSSRDLYQAILQVLRNLEDSLTGAPRDVSMIATGVVIIHPEFKGIEKENVEKAVSELAGASQGALILKEDDEVIHITTNIDELERRVASLTKSPTTDRRISSFRK